MEIAARIVRIYAPTVHLLAAGTFLFWLLVGGAAWQTALLYAVAVLIVTCPCALALAVPVVQVVAANRLFRQGVLVKSPTALERLAAVDTIVLDKTGTVTLGRPARRTVAGSAGGTGTTMATIGSRKRSRTCAAPPPARPTRRA